MKSTKNILIVSDERHIGGANTVIEELSESLAKLKHNVIVLEGYSSHSVIPDTTQETLVTYIRYKINISNSLLTQLSYLYGLWRSITRISKHTDLDTVITNFAFSAGICCLHPAINNRIHFIFHGDEPKIMWTLIPSPKKYFILGWIKRYIFSGPFYLITYVFQQIAFRKSLGIFTFSTYARNYLINELNQPSNKIYVIKPGINKKIFRPPTSQSKIRQQLNIAASYPIILCTSRFEPRKGIKLLLQSLTKVVRTYPKTLLILASPLDDYYIQSGYFTELIHAISNGNLSEHVLFLFNLQRHELVSYYQAANLYVLPSINLETFGLVTLEALSCGLPVVCYNKAGAPEEIVKKISPLLIFKTFTPEALSKTILAGLHDKRKFKKLSKSCISVSKQYTWIQTAQNMLNIIG